MIFYYVAKSFNIIISIYVERYVQKKKKEDTSFDRSFVDIIKIFGKVLIWVLAILLILGNLGIEITPLLTGLGIGGIAIAFALQNVLSDIFAYFTIQFDKPFKIGDFIIIGTDMGVIEYIGIKSTRVKTLQGQELVVPNKELSEIRINNYKKMEKRRIVFAFGVEYGTPTAKLKKINTIVTNIFNKIEHARLDRVHLKSFGDFSLNYEVVYYLDSSDYLIYMDTQQDINFSLKNELEKIKVEMAFPTQTIHVKK